MDRRRRAVVTGGAKGIGLAVVERLAAAGHDVVALGRDEDALAAAGVAWRRCDVTSEDDVVAVLGSLEPVDVLVNNAGVAESAPLGRTTLDSWRRHLDVNATGPFLCTRAVLPGMVERRWGRVVTVASIASHRGASYIGAYAASKHAALGLARAAAAEVAGTGVTVNSVCPAYVRTPMTERTIATIVERTGRTEAEAVAALVGKSGLGRLVEPAEVAGAVAYLVSEDAAAVNGQSIVIDGGEIQQ